ncbi:hypothetical protein [Vibrio aerogenes]|nr:hypothetical protein [Vibrio aerogenes]
MKKITFKHRILYAGLLSSALVFSGHSVFASELAETQAVVSSAATTLSPDIDDYYLPPELSFISWDYPVVGHTGLDVDYKLTGYDWFNRELSWSVVSGPAGMTIDSDGTLHWKPATEGDYDVTIALDIGGQQTLHKTFTMTVDNARTIFIAPDGDNTTGDGTIENPYATFGDAVAKKIRDLKGKATVYHRGGSYQNYRMDWFGDLASWNMKKLNSQLRIDKEHAVMIRNYPGENPVLNLSGNGFRIYQDHWIYYGMEITGGFGSEGANLIVFGESVAKRVLVSDYHHSYKTNPTGIKAAGPVILDQVIARDNYDRENPSHHNSSNFLFYGESRYSKTPAFFIDCLSLYSDTVGVGFKVKHAGDDDGTGTILHIHKSADIGSRKPFGMVQNGTSIRYSYAYSDTDKGAINLSVTDPLSPIPQTKEKDYETHTDEGMLIEHNLLINSSASGRGMSQVFWALNQDPEHPVVWRNNTIETHGAGKGNLFTSGLYDPLPETWTIQFNNNKIYTPSPENAVIIDEKTYSADKLAEYGSANQLMTTDGTYQFTVANQVFNISHGELVDCESASEVSVYSPCSYVFSDSFEDGTFDEADELFDWSNSPVVGISYVKDGQSYWTRSTTGETIQIDSDATPLPLAEYGTVKAGESEPTNLYSMDMKYNAESHWSELHFDLGKPYKELWIRYWLRVPENFEHRGEQRGGSNMKLLALYMDGYSQHGTAATAVWEFWRDSHDNGDSLLAWHYRDVNTDVNTGHRELFEFIRVPEDRGRWMQLVMHVKASSENGVKDGVLETYRRWSDEDEFTRYHYSDTEYFSVPEDPEYAGWRKGYFMGWSNPGFAEETHWLIDGVEFSEKPLLDVVGVTDAWAN